MKNENFGGFLTLGDNCQVSKYLAASGLQRWGHLSSGVLLRNIRGVVKVIESEAERFFSFDNLRVRLVEKEIYIPITEFVLHKPFPNYVFKDAKGNARIYDQDTGIESYHNFPVIKPFEESMAKFNRRNELLKPMFMDKLKNHPTLQIVRTNSYPETLDDIVLLRDLIHQMRDGLDFDLHVFQDSHFMQKDWGVKNLHTYHRTIWKWEGRSNGSGNWRGEPDLWENFFRFIWRKACPIKGMLP